MSEDPGLAFVRVPVANLLKIVNPFITPPWHCEPFTEDDVWESIEQENFQDEPTPNWHPKKDHVARIAFLVVEGWPSTDLPHLDVGIPGMGDPPLWPLEDGNHRLCAAVVRCDKTIDISLSGSLKYAEELLGIDCDVDFLRE